MPALAPGLSIVATKLIPPTQLAELLPRKSLMPLLEAAIDARLLLVTAPAGYGKSSALSQLYERLRDQGRRVAWLSLDSNDNDVARFSAHLVEAIERSGLQLSPREESDPAQQRPGPALSAEALRVELLNRLAGITDAVHVFLDDFHLLQKGDSRDLVNSILLSPLPHVHFVIASRDMPKLSLARLRALGSLREIEAGDLAFSAEEAGSLVATIGAPPLTESQISRLRDKTEGWPASLKLASIAMRSAKDADVFLDRFSGADRSVADFLVEEVLGHLDQSTQRFLLATSLLRRFSSSLANAVLGIKDAREAIDKIETLNLFILSLDRERNWYRYHHLFADTLRARLSENAPEAAVEYHRRACDWLTKNGYSVEAIEHAFAAGDIERAGALVDTACGELFASGQNATLQSYADRLPADLLRRLPRLQLELAWEYIIRWQFEKAVDSLNNVGTVLNRRDDSTLVLGVSLSEEDISQLHGRLDHRRLMLAAFRDDFVWVLRHSQDWFDKYGTRDAFMSSSIATAGMMCRRESYSVDLQHAEWESLRSRFIGSGAIFGTVFLDTIVGTTLHLRGELNIAEQALEQARHTAILLHGEQSDLATMPTACLASLMYEKNDLAAARELLDEASDRPLDFGLVDAVIARQITLASLATADELSFAAHRALDSATSLADKYGLPRLHAHVLAERVRILIRDGLTHEAERLSHDRRYEAGLLAHTPAGEVNSAREMYALASARIAMEKGDSGSAQILLKRWLAWSRDHHCPRSTVRIALLLARMQVRAGDRLAARRSLIDALRAGVGGFIRPFIDEGKEVTALLWELNELRPGPEVCSQDYLGQILKACGGSPSNPTTGDHSEPTSALSARELEIMRLSATSLVAHEVAEALGLTENTVKWYWQRIFEKLGVRRRSAAVRIARDRGLI